MMRGIGRLFFLLMWVPFAYIMFVLIRSGRNEMSLSELPADGQYAFTAVFALMCLSMLFTFGSPLVASIKNGLVRGRGRSGTARIVEIEDTGMTINESPVVRLTLEVSPDTGAPFEADTEAVIARTEIPQFQPGTRVRVKYDSRSKEVALDDE